MSNNTFLLNSFEYYINSIGFANFFSFSEKQINNLICPSITFIDIPIGKNEALTPRLSLTLNHLKVFLNNLTITFNSLYTDYIKIATMLPMSQVIYSFPDFVNGLSILESILSAFNTDLLKINIHQLHEYKINIIYLDNLETQGFDSLKSFITKTDTITNFILLFFIFSLEGKLSFSQLSNDNLFNNLNMYNQFYISHFGLGLLVHFGLVVYSNLYNNKMTNSSNNIINKKINSNVYAGYIGKSYVNDINNIKMVRLNKSVGQFQFDLKGDKTIVSQRNNRKEAFSFHVNNNNFEYSKSQSLSLYLFDNSTVKYNIDEIKLVVCLNDLKCFLYANIVNIYKYQIDITLVKPDFIFKTDLCKNNKAYSLFSSLSQSIKDNHNTSNVVFQKRINEIFNQWPIDQFIIEIKGNYQLEQIMKYLVQFEGFILKCTRFYLRDITIEKNQIDNQSNDDLNLSYLSIETLFTEWIVLEEILKKMYYIKDNYHNKNCSTSSFIFNSWKLVINKSSSSSKSINLYFNYSNIQEKVLFNHLATKGSLNDFITRLIQIITILELFKGYSIVIRLFQNNFRSQQLNFDIQLITHVIVNYVQEKKWYKSIEIYEKNFNNYNGNMYCYIKGSDENKLKYNKLKNIYNKVSHIKYFQFLFIYLKQLSSIFNVIIFSESSDAFKVIRSFEENYLFIILSVNQKESKTLSSRGGAMNTLMPMHIIQNTDNEQENMYSIKLYVYLNNDQDVYIQSLSLLTKLKTDRNRKCILEITIIIEKSFFENTFSESKFIKYNNGISEDIDHFYIISKLNNSNLQKKEENINSIDKEKDTDIETFRYQNVPSESIKENGNSNDNLDYDIYITTTHIRVITYNKYDRVNDVKYKHFLYDFIAVVSNSIELMIYLIKLQGRLISRFLYLYKTIDDIVYELDFKNGNLFIKQINQYSNIITMDMNDAVPILCLLSNKDTSSYTISNENFYDVFIRLLLNLNQISESKDNLNEILFKKLHKNIFKDYYDAFYPIAFSYQAFKQFNDFFYRNDYLSFTNNEKFKRSYIIPFDSFSSYQNTFRQNMTREVIVFCSEDGVINKQKSGKYIYFSFGNLELLIKELKDFVKINEINRLQVFGYLKKKIKEYNLSLKIMNYYCFKGVKEYYIDKCIFEEKIEKYMKEKVNINTMKKLNNDVSKQSKKNNMKEKNCYLI